METSTRASACCVLAVLCGLTLAAVAKPTQNLSDTSFPLPAGADASVESARRSPTAGDIHLHQVKPLLRINYLFERCTAELDMGRVHPWVESGREVGRVTKFPNVHGNVNAILRSASMPLARRCTGC